MLEGNGVIGKMEEEENVLIDYLNKERHGYLNDLQVILGYVQLGKNDKVIDYIHRVIKNLDKEREIFKSNDINRILEYVKNKDV